MARPESALRPAQRVIAALILSTLGVGDLAKIPGAIIAADMGFGKSGSTLTAIARAMGVGAIRKVLVVAPLLVAQVTWPDEIEAWEHTEHLSYTVLRPDDDDPQVKAWVSAKVFSLAEAKKRRLAELAAQPTQIHLINKELLPDLFEHFGEANWPYDFVVWDEPNKSGKKKTGKGRKDDPLSRFGILCRVRKHLKAVVQLTGTPTPKGLENLWALAYLTDFGERLGRTKTAFLNRWFSVNVYNGVRKIKPHQHSFNEIMGLVKDIMFSIDPKDLAQLPPLVIDPVKVKLPPKALQQYRQFKRDMVSEELDVEAVNKGVLHNKLLQFANGSMYQEDGNDIPIHDAKLRALEDIVENIDGAPLLVAYTYQFDLDRIRSRFPKAVVLNEGNPRETVRLWNEKKIPMLLVHRLSAGHGLNLQFGSNHMCEYGLTSDLEQYLQFLKRLQRPGQTGSVVFNHVIIAEGTIDEEVFPSYINPKKQIQDAVLDAVKLDMANFADSAADPGEDVLRALILTALAA